MKLGRVVVSIACMLLLNAAGFRLSVAGQAAPTRTLTLSYAQKFDGLTTVVPPETKRRPRIGLALAGGGARAAASLGVLKALRDEGIPVAAIAGTSMGSIVGGFAAAGYSPEEIERIFVENNWNDLFTDTPPRAFLTQERKEAENHHLLQFSFIGGRFIAPSGLTAGQKLNDLLMTRTLSATFQSGMNFDRLPIPFRAVATDLETGSVAVIGKGHLHSAIRASSAVPGLFPPVEINGKLLVDGGLANNLPVDVARSMGADIVIAVDASAPLDRKERLSSLLEIMSQSVSIPVRRETEKQAARADIVITPDVGDFSFADFDRMGAIAAKGNAAARSAMGRIRELMKQRERQDRSLLRSTISSLSVRGTKTISAESVRAAFRRPVPGAWTDEELLDSLAAAFQSGALADARLELTGSGDAYDAVLTVVENPVVDAISISGVSLIPAGEVMDELDGQLGAPLNAVNVIAALDRVVQRYRDRGFLLVHVERARILPGTGTLSLVIREGRLDSLRLAGHRRTSPSLVRRETQTAPGAPVNFATLAEDIQHLYGLNYFETLDADIGENPDGGVDLTFKVREKPRGTVRFGLRYDLEDAFTGLTDVVVDNLLGKGVRFALETRYGNYTDVTMGYRSPVLINSYFVHRLEGFYRNRTYHLYQDQKRTGALEISRTGFDFSFGYEWFRFGDTYLRYRLSSDRQTGIYGVSTREQPVQTGSLAFLTTIDTRDNGLFPRSGFLIKGSHEIAAASYGGDIDFRKTTLSGQFAEPLTNRFTLVAAVFSGFGSGSLPYQELYGLGGADTLISAPLAGYQRREFAGSNMVAASIGCRVRFADYQLKAARALYLSAAGGAGNVWDSRDAIASRALLKGASIGLHADTIVGPFRLDFGAGEDRRYNVYFSAGYDY